MRRERLAVRFVVGVSMVCVLLAGGAVAQTSAPATQVSESRRVTPASKDSSPGTPSGAPATAAPAKAYAFDVVSIRQNISPMQMMMGPQCVFRSKWASDSTGSGTRFRLKRDMIPLGSGPHFGLERNAVPHGTESRPAWNGTGDGGVESEQAALVIPGRCFPEVKGEYFARTEITHEKNTRNPTPPF
jgi:hypothetical protein